MTSTEELKLQLIELCGSLEAAQAAFAWVVEVPAPAPVPAPVEGGVVLTDDEVLSLNALALKDAAMLRLAAKQNTAPVISTKEVDGTAP